MRSARVVRPGRHRRRGTAGGADRLDGRNAAALGLAVRRRQVVKEEEPSSLAITSNSGPYHPVRMDGPMDYGAYDAKFGADRGGRRHEDRT